MPKSLSIGGRDNTSRRSRELIAMAGRGIFGFIERRADFLIFAVVGFSLILGLISMLEFRRSPFFLLPVLDEDAYVKWAMDIVSGGPLGGRVFYQDPAYPYFLALVFKVFGTPEPGISHLSWFAVRVIQVLLGAASAGLVFITARRLTGRSQALLAAVVLSLCHSLYFYEVLLLKGAPVIFFSALLCYLGVAAGEQPAKGRRWFLLGAGLGVLCLLRGNFLLLCPFLLLWPLFIKTEKSIRTRIYRSGCLTAGLAVMLLPSIVHNYRASGELLLTTSQAGANFYIGNNEYADGSYVNLPFVNANPEREAEDFKKEAERRSGGSLSPARISRFWFLEGLTWIKAHPGDAVQLWIKKILYLFNNYEIPDNHNFYVVRRLFMGSLWASFIGFGLLWGPALMGMAAVRGRREGRFLIFFVAAYSVSLIAFFIVARYRLALLPPLSILAVIGLSWVIGKFREKKYGKTVSAVAALAVAFLIGFFPVTDNREAKAFNILAVAYFRSGEPLLAFDCQEWALAISPADPEIQQNRRQAIERLPANEQFLVEFGDQADRRGRTRLAVEVFERAVELFADSFEARARLGVLYAVKPEVKNPEKALAHLLAADQLQPNTPHLMVSIGNLYFESGKPAEARRWWERTVAAYPGYEPALGNLERLRDAGGF